MGEGQAGKRETEPRAIVGQGVNGRLAEAGVSGEDPTWGGGEAPPIGEGSEEALVGVCHLLAVMIFIMKRGF